MTGVQTCLSDLATQPKVKEADHVKITALPRVDQLRAFRNMVRQEVTAASGRGDPAFLRIREVESDRATFEKFAISGDDYASLDCKLATALTKACGSSTLAQEIVRVTEAEAKAARNIKGRQILFMIYEHFKSDQEVGKLFQYPRSVTSQVSQ